MKPAAIANILKSLATQRKLEIVRALLEADDPVASSVLSQLLEIPPPQMSDNLMQLAHNGIILRQQSGRMVFYAPNRRLIADVMRYFETEK